MADDEHKKPREYTYGDYLAEVELAAEVALDALEENGGHKQSLEAAVRYAISNDPRYTDYGHMLVTVIHTDQHPDEPDYSPPWSEYVDFDNDPTWSDCVQQMAFVCYQSDVMDRARRSQDPEEDYDVRE